MGVDDVEAGRRAPPQLAAALGYARRPPGSNANSSTSTSADAPQRVDLVADEAPERRALGGSGTCSSRSARASAREPSLARVASCGDDYTPQVRWPRGSGSMESMARTRRAAGRRVRLRRRRADRAARAARVAADRGLRLSRRHRAVPVRRADAGASCARSRSRSPSTCSSSARSCSSSPATQPARRRSGALERALARGGRDVDVIGVVAPATQLAVAGSRTGRIGLLATPATVLSGAYERAVRAADPHVHLESVACPDLAPIIQGGFPFDDATVETVRGYCAPLREARGRHGDPRLHPLPAGARRCSSARSVAA